jgi:hypothetical protein
MKKLLFYLMAMSLCFGFSSCKEDDPEPSFKTVVFHAEYDVAIGDELSAPPQWSVILLGEGEAEPIGESSWESTTTISDFAPTGLPPFDPPFVQVGTMTFTTPNGSTLVGSYEGTFDGLGGSGTYEIESGTGDFAGATTEADCDCTYFWINNPEDLNYLEFNGTLTMLSK